MSTKSSKEVTSHKPRRVGRLGVAAAIAAAVMLPMATPAFANTSNPTTVSFTSTLNSDGTVTVTLNDAWVFPNQACSGRYGTGWAVGWWGVGSSSTPTNNFTLTNVSQITAVGQGENGSPPSTGSTASTGSVKFPSGGPFAGQYFYTGPLYDGSEIFTSSFCASQSDPNNPVGTVTATATYPSPSDVPSEICVNTYDEHGGHWPGDFTPSGQHADGDNAIQMKQFTESSSCASVPTTVVPSGSIGILPFAGGAALVLVLLQTAAVWRRRRSTAAAS